MNKVKWLALIVALIGGMILFPQVASAKSYHSIPKTIRGTWYDNTNDIYYRQFYTKTRVTKDHVYVTRGSRGNVLGLKEPKHTYSLNSGKKANRIHVAKDKQGFYILTTGKMYTYKMPKKSPYKRGLLNAIFVGRPMHHKLKGKTYRVMEQYVQKGSAPFQRWYAFQYPKLLRTHGTVDTQQTNL